jgi:hypothetical protein
MPNDDRHAHSRREEEYPILSDCVLLFFVKGQNSATLEAIQEGIVP